LEPNFGSKKVQTSCLEPKFGFETGFEKKKVTKTQKNKKKKFSSPETNFSQESDAKNISKRE